ncbi:RNA polymerase sigma factor [Catalinimonas niigatensis]|uniref:RNA polymerase sigma factor n=1 Tax=Catalinimonas niigatensis TaxID=1397264 RepID=UPI002667104D|nr:sigma-70 family RNA polymerase sigma factor [Catalinimonas niigatensis]WPP50348.1 sigma-70 family RNA polymerase sigma factor [Catalinimonas niigatensis]
MEDRNISSFQLQASNFHPDPFPMNEKQVDFRHYGERIEGEGNIKPPRLPDNYSRQSEAAIWKAFRNGEEDALVYIYEEYANKMYRYGCQFSPKRELVSDSIQELFTEIISNRHKLGDTSSIKFYLFKSLRRKIFRALKKEKIFISVDEAMKHADFNILEDSSLKFMYQEFSDQQKVIIAAECNKLPAKQKEALLLYFYEGMSYKEIAETIGMSRTKSARALIYRAIDSMSKFLQPYKDVLYPLWPFLIASALV